MKTLTFKTSSGATISLERTHQRDIVLRIPPNPSGSIRLSSDDAETLKNLLENMDSSR